MGLVGESTVMFEYWISPHHSTELLGSDLHRPCWGPVCSLGNRDWKSPHVYHPNRWRLSGTTPHHLSFACWKLHRVRSQRWRPELYCLNRPELFGTADRGSRLKCHSIPRYQFYAIQLFLGDVQFAPYFTCILFRQVPATLTAGYAKTFWSDRTLYLWWPVDIFCACIIKWFYGLMLTEIGF